MTPSPMSDSGESKNQTFLECLMKILVSLKDFTECQTDSNSKRKKCIKKGVNAQSTVSNIGDQDFLNMKDNVIGVLRT